MPDRDATCRLLSTQARTSTAKTCEPSEEWSSARATESVPPAAQPKASRAATVMRSSRPATRCRGMPSTADFLEHAAAQATLTCTAATGMLQTATVAEHIVPPSVCEAVCSLCRTVHITRPGLCLSRRVKLTQVLPQQASGLL